MIFKILSQIKFKQGEDYKSKFQQFLEFFYYFIKQGLTPYEYNLYYLALKNKTKTIVKNYLSNRELNKIREKFNYGDKKILLDKLLSYQFFISHRLPTARILASYGANYNFEGVVKLDNQEDLIKFLKVNQDRKIVIKPSGGVEGVGIIIPKKIVIDCDQAYLIDAKNNKILVKDLFSILEKRIRSASVDLASPGFIVQEYIQQHYFLEKICPDVLNTFRIITFREPNHPHRISINFAILRLGGEKSLTDNWSRGGLSVGIDLKTGRLESGRAKLENKWLTNHPKTNIKFSGFSIPYWDKIIALARRASQFLPKNLNWIGWDIALTDRGPILLEGNCNWGIMSIQIHNQAGLRDQLFT